jgi:hypothetical protein
MRQYFILLLPILIIISCRSSYSFNEGFENADMSAINTDSSISIIVDTLSPKNEVLVSFTNLSGEHFKVFRVNVAGLQFVFETFRKDETRKLLVPRAYKYCYMQAITLNKGDTLTLAPEDYVGENQFNSGKLDFKLLPFVSKYNGRQLRFESFYNGKKVFATAH